MANMEKQSPPPPSNQTFFNELLSILDEERLIRFRHLAKKAGLTDLARRLTSELLKRGH